MTRARARARLRAQYAAIRRPFADAAWPAREACSAGDEPLPKRPDEMGAWRTGGRGVLCYGGLPPASPAAPLVRIDDERVCCFGHFEDDRWYEHFPTRVGGVTNGRMLALLDPTRPVAAADGYGVVYHHFRWSHCTEFGWPFEDLERGRARGGRSQRRGEGG